MESTAPCFCGNQQAFSQCCGPILAGTRTAKTAEQLMRSRFSAFCSANVDYLIQSHHPSKRQHNDRQSLTETINECNWLTLSIINTKRGLAEDTSGEVEFIASYTHQGKTLLLQENSRFINEHKQWFYLDGDIIDSPRSPSDRKLKRNDSCWCGSGQKFKKCHG
ncbi:MAG: YchJ family metal-binding protein [Spongiibacteraceae bacterium]